MNITKKNKLTILPEMALPTKETSKSTLPTYSINSESIAANIAE